MAHCNVLIALSYGMCWFVYMAICGGVIQRDCSLSGCLWWQELGEYEQDRQANMARNAAFLASLGL